MKTWQARTRRRTAMTSVAVMALACTAVGYQTTASEATSPSTGGLVGPHHPVGQANGALSGVKALAPDDVWIVGTYTDPEGNLQPVVRNFDGAAWSRVGPLDLPPGVSVIPNSIDAMSADDDWVTCNDRGGGDPIVEHWDGTTWRLQDISHAEGTRAELTHVWENRPDDAPTGTGGTSWCWGCNTSGQLGLGDTSNRHSPTQVSGTDWTRVSAGYAHTCGTRTDHALWCWGSNSYGQLGLGDAKNRLVPKRV